MSATRALAEVAGTVWQIQCAVGDAVDGGQTLIVLESMKMEIPIDAPAAGTVGEIHVAEGDAVSEGDVLVTLA